MNMADLKDYLEMLQYIAVVIGIPIALYQYRKDKEYEAYNALDEKFIEYLNLCLNNIDLDIFDVSNKELKKLNHDQQKNEIIIFTILFSIFERSYTMYYGKRRKIKKQQWEGWKQYIIEFSKRQNFIAAWKISGETFHEKFQEFMNKEVFTIEK